MKKILTFILLVICNDTLAQRSKPIANVERVSIAYKGKTVKAKNLKVTSVIPMNINRAWNNVKSPQLLQFVAKGMIRFKSTDGNLPKKWELDSTYGVKLRVFGFIPFGGTHYLRIEKIDDENFEIATKEWDHGAKVWNHNVVMKDLGNDTIYYEDSITIYGGMLTGLITSFAKIFYKHRQRRWQKVAKENLTFGD